MKKMENHTIVQLKAIANERGKSGYYKLRRAELIHALEAARLVEQKSNIFDASIPNDPSPVLQPSPWRPSNVTTKAKQNIKQKIKDFVEWLLNYIPPKQKVVDKVLESFQNKIKKMYDKRDILFQPTHSKSALKNFAIQYQIKDQMDTTQNHFCLTLSCLLQTL